MQRNTQGSNMRPKKTRQQDTLMSRINGPPGPLARAPMITEYQERFLLPCCYKSFITTSRGKDPYHPLRGTNEDICTFRSSFVVQNWRKNPPQPPQPSEPSKDYRKQNNSATRPAVNTVANRMPPKQDFVTVYQSDFQPRVVDKQQPFRLKNNFNIKYGIVALDHSAEEDKRSKTANSTHVRQEDEPIPMESITSYRSEYVSHPVQPRPGKVKPAPKPSQVQPLEPAAASSGLKAAVDKGHLKESSDFFDKFQSWSLETKFYGQTKEPSQPEEHRFVQMTHKCQGTKPIFPSMQTSRNSVEPILGTTTKGDFRASSAPQFTKTKPSRRCPELNNTAGYNLSCDARNKPQFPVEKGVFGRFEHFTENEGTQMFWSNCVDTGEAEGDSYVEPSQTHHRVRSSVSRRN